MTRTYRCKRCDTVFDHDGPGPPERCPNDDCGATFGGGWVDDLARLR